MAYKTKIVTYSVHNIIRLIHFSRFHDTNICFSSKPSPNNRAIIFGTFLITMQFDFLVTIKHERTATISPTHQIMKLIGMLSFCVACTVKQNISSSDLSSLYVCVRKVPSCAHTQRFAVDATISLSFIAVNGPVFRSERFLNDWESAHWSFQIFGGFFFQISARAYICIHRLTTKNVKGFSASKVMLVI